MSKHFRNKGSFRDPSGSVYQRDGRIFRTVNPIAKQRYEWVRDSSILNEAARSGFLVETQEITRDNLPDEFRGASYVLEHTPIPFISYPYEWTFNQLKDAAIHHLEFQLFLLEKNAVLMDSTAYNIQFVGSQPIFIDALSLAPYEEGQYWGGHRQFCEQFLNPLLLRAKKGICHNHWYRGSLEGISVQDMDLLLSFKDKLSWNCFTHVYMQSKLNRYALSSNSSMSRVKKSGRLSKLGYQGMLMQMLAWIRRMRPKNSDKTEWQNYAQSNPYESEERSKKYALVRDFSKRHKPSKLVDLGCNTGDYCMASLEGGARYVLGYDFDQNALDMAYSRSQKVKSAYLPLWMDLANPSPTQGWRQVEREGFLERTQADAVIALALEHHLAIGRNVPLSDVVKWILDLAPFGLIEFIPKDDPSIQQMLSLRQDVFHDYSEREFVSALEHSSRIIARTAVSSSGRAIYEFARRNNDRD